MITDWLAQWPALVVAAGVVFVPGLAIGAGLRLRGLALWALAPVASTVVIAGAAVVLALVGIEWSPLSAVIALIAAIAAAWLAGIALGRPRSAVHPSGAARWLLPAGLVIGASLGALRFGFLVGDPAAVSQTNDAVFHLNALRFIIDAGSASSFDISAVVGGRGFYPAAWHGIASLVVMLSGASIPIAANAVALVIVAGIWPVGIAWFTRVITKGSTPAAPLAAALSASLLTFPLLMLQWGVLYPYALSVALVPAVAAIAVGVPQWLTGGGPVSGRRRNGFLAGTLFLAGVGAIALAQPATLLTVGLLVSTWFTWWVAAHAGEFSPKRRVTMFVALAGAWVILGVAWILLSRSTSGSQWPVFRGIVRAFLDTVVNSQVMLPAAVGTSILMVAGLVVAVRRPGLRWLATAWLAFAVLYVVCAAVGQGTIRQLLLGAWYADPYRIAALAPIVVIPLAAIGLSAIVDWAAAALSRQPSAVRPDAVRPDAIRPIAVRPVAWALVAVAGVGIVSLAAAPVIHLPDVVARERETQSRYASNADSFLSPDERALAERLAETVPDDARIIGNPSAGTGFAYFLSGRDVYPRTWAPPTSSAWRAIEQDLRDVARVPEVCTALDEIGGARYVLDFGPGEAAPGRYIVPAMTGLAGQDGFELVDEQGDASLWRVTACDP